MKAALERYFNAVWYERRQQPPAALRLLVPLYRLAAGKRFVRPAGSSPLPVIVVGNITVGGSGKTPVVAALAQQLKQAGQRPAIISRGYGGQSHKTPVAVRPDSDPQETGDEPVLLARRAGCPVWVCVDRERALQAATADGASVVLADDGLQQPRLPRSFEICVIDGLRGLGNGQLLPAGPLRQPPERIEQADWALVKQSSDSIVPDDLPGQPFAVMPGPPYLLSASERNERSRPDRSQVFDAVCAIGNPDSFFLLLEALGYEFRPHAFADHHRYTAADIAGLAGPLIVTEKDAVKLERLADLPETWVLPIQAELPQALIDTVLQHVEEFVPS